MDLAQLDLLKKIIQRHIPNKTVWAYGSRVAWKASEISDLDLVVFDAGERSLADLREGFEESNLLISVDALDWESIPDDFKKEIKKKYVVLQDQAEGAVDLPTGWHRVRLGDLGQFKGGVTSIKRDDYGFGTPFITYLNIFNNSKIDVTSLEFMNVPKKDVDKLRCQYGDIFFTASSETEKEVAVSSVLLDEVEDLTFNGFSKRFRLDNFKELSPLYARYLFRSTAFRNSVNQRVTGDVRFNISQQSLAEIEAPLPPLREQEAVADTLGALDDKIDLLRCQNETLEAVAQTLFRKRLIEEADETWQAQQLDEIYNFVKGAEPGSKKYLDEQGEDRIRFIRVGDMLDYAPSTFVDVDDKYASSICDEQDLLVSFDGTIGRVTFGIAGVYSSGIRKITSPHEYYNDLGFKYLLFKSPQIQHILKAHSGGTVLLHASSAIPHLVFRMPSADKVKSFNKEIKHLFPKYQTNLTQIDSLAKLRDTLLPRLVLGVAEISA